jgi:hypothetical protein
MEFKILATIILTVMMVTGGVGSVQAEKKSAYDSGFDHGCSDAQISNPANWYINGVNSKGESTGKDHHTAAFNTGYDAGFKECGYDNGVLIGQQNTAVDDSFNNRDSVVQPQSQSANTVQSNQCPQMVINGDCITGQEQSTNNDFAQANRAEN